MIKSRIYRSVWLPAAVTTVLFMVALGMMIETSWRSLHRLQPVHNHLFHSQKLQSAELKLEKVIVQHLRTGEPVESKWLADYKHDVESLYDSDGYLVPETQVRLAEVIDRLAEPNANAQERLGVILEEMLEISSSETMARDDMMLGVESDTRLELLISTSVTVAVPLTGLGLLFLMRRRFLLPLQNLSDLMSLLSRREYRTVPTNDLDPLLRPVFENYNEMTNRLLELGKQHETRQHTLEEEVRSATGALLQQQHELAQAVRLATVGEFAAGIAHELRNPLAGMQMALSGLQNELKEPERRARLELVITELKRVTRLLNDLLSLSRRSPEPPVPVVLGRLVDELLSLVRYQVPEGTELEQDIPSEVCCRLPEGGLRQALLNLVLNAAQAIGDRSGKITISARQARNRLELSVSDDGSRVA